MSLSDILQGDSLKPDSLVVLVEATISRKGWRKKVGQLEKHRGFLVDFIGVDPKVIRTFLVYGSQGFFEHPRKGKEECPLDYALFIDRGDRGGGAFEQRVYQLLQQRFNGGTKPKIRYDGRVGENAYICGEIDVLLTTNVDKWNAFLDSYPHIVQNPLT